VFRRDKLHSFGPNEYVKKIGGVMDVVIELLASVAVVCGVGTLLFIATIVLVTAHDAVKLVPSTLHRIMRRIQLKASQSHSNLLAAAANAKTQLGVAASALLPGEARNRIAHLK
jgi:hypothetical protein